MQLLDSHCHLDAPVFKDTAAVLQQAGAAGVKGIIVPAYQADRWQVLLDMQVKYDQPTLRLWPALGVHPLFLAEYRPQHLDLLAQYLAQQDHIVAVGEIGLDRYEPALREPELWQRQVALFEAQLALAKQFNLPVILHARRCHSDIVRCIKRVGLNTGGIVHAFSGSLEEANNYIALGFKLGFGGALTYESARRIRAVAAALPQSCLVIETDAPDMLPSQCRHMTQNHPANLSLVLASLANLRQTSAAELATALWHNTIDALQIQEFL
ncbi:MAG: TatD family hydrolase [Moraxellaceae bacterium]|nr:TatD family hydrolase [Moraxellaceae bacterium]MDZ4387922.1 TatD family hydrolase [Moraxellaceae bacterium]